MTAPGGRRVLGNMIWYIQVQPKTGSPFRLLSSRGDIALLTADAISSVAARVLVVEKEPSGAEKVIFESGAEPANDIVVFE